MAIKVVKLRSGTESCGTKRPVGGPIFQLCLPFQASVPKFFHVDPHKRQATAISKMGESCFFQWRNTRVKSSVRREETFHGSLIQFEIATCPNTYICSHERRDEPDDLLNITVPPHSSWRRWRRCCCRKNGMEVRNLQRGRSYNNSPCFPRIARSMRNSHRRPNTFRRSSRWAQAHRG